MSRTEFARLYSVAAVYDRRRFGVHYPSDSEAGRVFARQFVDALLQNDKFKTAFAQVREEWSRVRVQSPD